MEVEIVSYETDRDDGVTIATLEVEAIPRVGDKLIITSDEFRRDDGGAGTVTFVVTDVFYDVGPVEGPHVAQVTAPQVIVNVEDGDIPIPAKLRLTCKCEESDGPHARQPDERDATRCRDCGLVMVAAPRSKDIASCP